VLKILFMLFALFAVGGKTYLGTIHNVTQAGPHSAPIEGGGVLLAVTGAAILMRRKKGKV
jgi:hypothetical protein